MKLLYIRIPSCLGIDLKALCRGAQEFRHCREIPITFLRVDVPEVDREVGQQRLHVASLLIPSLHTGHRERMAKRHEAGAPPTSGRLYGQALAQPSEPVVEGQIPQMIALVRHEKSVRQPIVVPVGSLCTVMAEALSRAGMERHNPRFMKLRLEDMQLWWIQMQFDMIDLQADGLAYS